MEEGITLLACPAVCFTCTILQYESNNKINVVKPTY